MKHVAVGILMRDGYVLACQRKPSAPYPLKWEFPGGKLEPNETPAEALTRELREELAISVTVPEEFYRQDWVYAEGTDDPATDGAFRVSYFLVRSFNGDPINRAFEQMRWVRPEELLTMDILEGNRNAIEVLVSSGGGRDAQHA